ncbi:hypothetical protein PV11_04480 [Exophiala sideris]|uniref:Uncharacterized protein n=1 Tax=Exophiala sideris TaxID=1016849 RepID=A0A0D1X407_9EURO|nr:hypothetical protein PV11_04480 [Exophiala sideris]
MDSTDGNGPEKRSAPESADFKSLPLRKKLKDLEHATQHHKAEARQSPTDRAKGSGWYQVLRYFSFCKYDAVDEKLATDVASITSALRGTTIHPYDVLEPKRCNHVTDSLLEIFGEPITAWWRDESIDITQLGIFLKPGAEEDLDQELERRGITIKPRYRVPGPTEGEYDPVRNPDKPWRLKEGTFSKLQEREGSDDRLTSVLYELLLDLTSESGKLWAEKEEKDALERLRRRFDRE